MSEWPYNTRGILILLTRFDFRKVSFFCSHMLVARNNDQKEYPISSLNLNCIWKWILQFSENCYSEKVDIILINDIKLLPSSPNCCWLLGKYIPTKVCRRIEKYQWIYFFIDICPFNWFKRVKQLSFNKTLYDFSMKDLNLTISLQGGFLIPVSYYLVIYFLRSGYV